VGAYASINGQDHIPKEKNDDIINDNDNESVGYFGMIDTTQFLSSSSSSSNNSDKIQRRNVQSIVIRKL
jgi:hypothetical protein